MRVKELVAELSAMDQGLEVVCYAEDEGLTGEPPWLLDVVGVKIVEAEKLRDEQGRPQLKFGTSDRSERLVLVEVMGDF